MEIKNTNNILYLSKNKSGMIYFAADETYFVKYGERLTLSALKLNPDWFVHAHIYDPSENLLKTIPNHERFSFSTEKLNQAFFEKAALQIKNPNTCKTTEELERRVRICETIKAHSRNRTCGIISHLLKISRQFCRLIPQNSLLTHLKKTYYACRRFSALEELIELTDTRGYILCLDADAVFVSSLDSISLPNECDIALHQRGSKTKPDFLAGAILLPPHGRRREFLKEVSKNLDASYLEHKLEWGLDQKILNQLTNQYRWQKIDKRLFDLEFGENSVIWMAKGGTKDSERFLNPIQPQQ